MQTTVKYRIYPNNKQEKLFIDHFGCARFIYNFFLEVRKSTYEVDKTSLSYNETSAKLTDLKSQDGYYWLNNVSCQALQIALKHLDTAYEGFFKQKSKYPQQKKKCGYQSFSISTSFKIINGKLYLPKFNTPSKLHKKLGGIKLIKHLKIEEKYLNHKLNSCTISKNPAGEYYASLQFSADDNFLPKLNTTVGIDLGIKTLVIESNGNTADNPKFHRKKEKKLKYLQRQLSKKKKGSKRQEKARKKLAKAHNNITNSRKDHTHKLTRRLIDENQVIIAENLAVKNMIQNHNLAKSIQDAGWGELTRQLKYKAAYYGRTYYEIDRFFASSKLCNNCKTKKEGLDLSERDWICSNCNSHLDRDINAAKNILECSLADIKAGKHLVKKVVKSVKIKYRKVKKNRVIGDNPDKKLEEASELSESVSREILESLKG